MARDLDLPVQIHADRARAHASIARENIAIALSDMMQAEYLSLDEAKRIGYDWLFGNANKFFRLNLSIQTPTPKRGVHFRFVGK